jgi:hypothetical protein
MEQQIRLMAIVLTLAFGAAPALGGNSTPNLAGNENCPDLTGSWSCEKSHDPALQNKSYHQYFSAALDAGQVVRSFREVFEVKQPKQYKFMIDAYWHLEPIWVDNTLQTPPITTSYSYYSCQRNSAGQLVLKQEYSIYFFKSLEDFRKEKPAAPPVIQHYDYTQIDPNHYTRSNESFIDHCTRSSAKNLALDVQ